MNQQVTKVNISFNLVISELRGYENQGKKVILYILKLHFPLLLCN